jgi:hypothetical protein
VPALQEALARKPGLETRTRIERLLAKANRTPPPEVLRSLRALEVLIRIRPAITTKETESCSQPPDQHFAGQPSSIR